MKSVSTKLTVAMLLFMVHQQAMGQKISFGVKAGIQENFMSIYYDKDEKVEGGRKGFHVAGTATFSVAEHLAIQPALMLSMKGGAYYTNGINVFALELPVNVLYKHNRFFIGGGPGVSYGISGRLTGKANGVDRNVYSDKASVPLKRFDVLANAILGYELPSNITVSAHVSRGLLNVSALEDQNTYTNKMHSFALSIGYKF